MSREIIHIPTKLEQFKVPLESITPYDRNPRKHSEKGIKALMDSMRLDGFVIPITVNQDNVIIAGHGRRLAALELKMEKVPVIQIHVTDEEFKRLVISDNKIAELSSWDNKLLKETMQYLTDIQDAELFVPGYTDEELDKVFGTQFKETIETTADFGESGEVDVMDEATRVTSMTFKMSVKDHKKVKATIGAIMRENDFETTGEAMVHMINKFKGPGKVIRRQA